MGEGERRRYAGPCKVVIGVGIKERRPRTSHGLQWRVVTRYRHVADCLANGRFRDEAMGAICLVTCQGRRDLDQLLARST
ncbi:MAG: hypothetical protein M3R02_12955 [Chloroflexota bacterium]|nr:hypothetical protein [Chloroflexota bacterium]